MIPIGKRYDGGDWKVDRDGFQAYAAATDDANPAYADVAPPMFHVRGIIDLMLEMARDPELSLDMLRLVHAGHDMRFHRPLRDGDTVHIQGELTSYEEKMSGLLVGFRIAGLVDGEAAFEGDTSYFIRGKKRPETPSAVRAAPEEPPPADREVTQRVTMDQADRYADASGDRNPIHIDPATAKAAGLPGVILHGLCTMAFAGRDVVDTLAGGDPTRLKRLAVRFASPVFPGQTLNLKVWGTSGNVRFQTENEDGRAVIVNGRAEVV